MISIFEEIIGDYVPITSSSGEIAAGCAGVNWSWVASAALLIICVYSIFRILGSIISK